VRLIDESSTGTRLIPAHICGLIQTPNPTAISINIFTFGVIQVNHFFEPGSSALKLFGPDFFFSLIDVGD
jgi:hypothetical protein